MGAVAQVVLARVQLREQDRAAVRPRPARVEPRGPATGAASASWSGDGNRRGQIWRMPLPRYRPAAFSPAEGRPAFAVVAVAVAKP